MAAKAVVEVEHDSRRATDDMTGVPFGYTLRYDVYRNYDCKSSSRQRQRQSIGNGAILY